MNSTNNIVPFNFYGDNLEVVKESDTLWISVRRVCEALGLDRKSQQKKLQEKPWATGVIITLPDARARNRDAFLVDLDTLLMWLATISHTASMVEFG